MNIERIRRRLSGGFRPFMLRVSDGREYRVPHPEFIMLGKYDVVVQDQNGEVDLIDPLHITGLHFLRRSNGKTK